MYLLQNVIYERHLMIWLDEGLSYRFKKDVVEHL